LEILKFDTSVLQYASYELRNELRKNKSVLVEIKNMYNKVRLEELKQENNFYIEIIPILDNEMNLFDLY